MSHWTLTLIVPVENLLKKESVKQIQDLCLDFDLVDIWRIRNPEFYMEAKKSFHSEKT